MKFLTEKILFALAAALFVLSRVDAADFNVSNIAMTNWISLGTNFPATSSFNFTDSTAQQFSNRFYRVVEP